MSPFSRRRATRGTRGLPSTLLRNLGHPHEATVASSQGPVIADLVSRLAEDDDVDLPSPPGSEKGGTWALTFRDDRLADAEYFAAPRPEACRDR